MSLGLDWCGRSLLGLKFWFGMVMSLGLKFWCVFTHDENSNFHKYLIRQFLHLIRREIGFQRLTENEGIFTNGCFENVETHVVPYSPRRSGETLVNMLLIWLS